MASFSHHEASLLQHALTPPLLTGAHVIIIFGRFFIFFHFFTPHISGLNMMVFTLLAYYEKRGQVGSLSVTLATF